MPYADNNGVRIHYQVEGEGPPLVLHHGLGCTLEDWRTWGYVGPLKGDYELILMDARGHGASDKPHDPEAYAMEHRVGDVVAVLDDLDIGSAHFFGYSMGGAIGFRFAKLAPEKARSLIIGGASPRDRNPNDPNPILEMLERGLESGLAVLFEASGPVSSEWRQRILANDLEALIASVKSPGISVEDDLPGMTMPFLVYAGESDGRYPFIKEYATRLPDATFVSLPGLVHIQGATRSDLVLPHIKKFLARVSQA